jgi:N-acetyl-gamma-glutamylphosphate reductase
MAIVNNGTVNSLSAELLPSGYTRPTVTEISDYDYVSELTLSVLKSTADDATKATTMTNIIGVATVGITAQIDAILAADYLASATVTAYTDWYKVSSNIEVNTTSDFFNDTAVSYTCYCRLYVKAV